MSIKINDNSLKSLRTYFNDKLQGIYAEEELSSLFFIGLDHYLKITRLQFLANPEATVSESDILRIRHLAKELRLEKPVQYILGECTFMDLSIKVNEHVLIPRPETEEIVDAIIKQGIHPKKIIDLCTGSGCIALALKKNFSGAEVTGIDISEKALIIAEENRLLNKLNVSFIQDDVLNLQKTLSKADLIVSNPPYVMDKEKKIMSKNVLEYEPELALFVRDEDPLVFYRTLISIAVEKLNEEGWLFMEINEKFGKEIIALMEGTKKFINLELMQDLNGKDRWVSGQKREL
jgi:release factor glutamine methyltransferase